MSAARRVGAAATVAGGLAGALYAAERIAAARVRRSPDGDAARALVAQVYADRHIPTHDGGTLYVVERGDPDAPPVVLSHGVTLSVRTWFHQLESLPQAGLRVIAFDHRGHGQSLLGDEGHSVENLGRDFKTLLEALDLENAVLVGHSMGGIAVESFVTQFSDVAARRVAGIVVLSSIAYTPFGSRSTRMKERIQKYFRRTPDTTGLWSRRNLGLALARVAFGEHPHPSHVELVRQMLRDCAHETRAEVPRTLIGIDFTPQLPDVRIPTLVIGGTADVITPPFEARRIAQLVPAARLEMFQHGGHMLMLERHDEIDRLVIEFTGEVQRAPEARGA